jgi:hypothetical protein
MPGWTMPSEMGVAMSEMLLNLIVIAGKNFIQKRTGR